MFYVTEDELREAWASERFTAYAVPEGAKLTPSARQFLIDFHIAFESADDVAAPARAAHAVACGKGASAADASALLADFCADMLVLAARARLVGRRALGVDREAARACDAVGCAWQQGTDVDGLLGDMEASDDKDAAVPVVIPGLSSGVHDAYYEMALLTAELRRACGFWAAAAHDMGADADVVERWVAIARRLAALLDARVALACEEVRHG